MKAYIHTCRTLSVLDSFESGILTHIHENLKKEFAEPDYKKIIPSTHLRRMSKVIRMGVGTALTVAGENNMEGIIVGTGLGCYDNSIQFTREYFKSSADSLSPTSFIQSTNNTIAGHIAMIRKNNSYNITYVHKGLAFENALLDAMLLSEEGRVDVLVGGVDEWIPSFELSAEIKNLQPDYWIGEGASFFHISQEKKDALAKIAACWMISANEKNSDEAIYLFLKKNGLELPHLILYGNSFVNQSPLTGNLLGINTLNYSNICGIYFTNSSFAMQLGTEIISNPNLAQSKGLKAEKILIVNNFYDSDFGLIYLSKS